MKSVSSTQMVGLAALLLVAFSAAPASALRAQLNPVGKVLSLLQGLSAKITSEAEAEEKSYKEYVEWCDDVSKNTQFDIKTTTDKKEQLTAKIAKATGDGQASASKIEELAGAVATADGDLTSATQIREKEASDFAKNEAELVDVIDTLGRAVDIVEREMAKNPAFAQVGGAGASGIAGMVKALGAVVDAAAFSSADKQKLLALVQNRQADSSEADDAELGAPAAAVYKSHSTSIVDTLEDLKETAEEQLSALRKAETSALHSYKLLEQSLKDQISADSKSKQEETASGAASAEMKSKAEGDLALAEKDLADAQEALKTANGGCMSVAADHEASVAARTAELKAIAEATKVLQDTTTGAVGQSYSLLQVADHQRRGGSRLRTRADLANAEVVNLVKTLAAKHHSGALTQLANRIATVLRYSTAAHEDPFGKVKSLISDMIARLEQEAHSEATEKSYCDEEMAKTEEKKGELEYDISKLAAKIEQAVAQSAELKGEVREHQTELAELAKTQADADSLRQEQHADYLQAKKDLEDGLAGVRMAITILREQYGTGAAAAAMLQSGSQIGALMQQPEAPVFHSKAMGEGTSILGLLDVIESDFAKDLATEETSESTSVVEYEKMTQVNKVTKTLKEQDVTYKTQEAKSLDKTAGEHGSDKETLSAEQSAVLEYYAKLKERCIAKPETYEERSRRREAEVKGLKDALSILEDEAAFVQRGKRGSSVRFLGRV